MSIHYSIDITIDLEFSAENIKLLLIHAKNIGFSFHKIDLDQIGILAEPLIIDDALNQITLCLNEEKFPAIATKINGTYFYLFIYNNEGNINLHASNFFYPSYRTFINQIEDIDISKYIKIMLDLTEPYRILHLLVEKN